MGGENAIVTPWGNDTLLAGKRGGEIDRRGLQIVRLHRRSEFSEISLL